MRGRLRPGHRLLLLFLTPLTLLPAAYPALVRAGPLVPCPGPKNLAADAAVIWSGKGTKGELGRLAAGTLAVEGGDWDLPGTVRFASTTGAAVTLDLQRAFPIRGVVVQADNNDRYRVESSTDGSSWAPLWDVEVVTDSGLRTRSRRLEAATPARYLRVSPLAGDGRFSLSELGLFCELPRTWPPALRPPPPRSPAPPGWRLTESSVDAVKAFVALLGLLLCLWALAVRRAGKPETDERLRKRLLLAAAALALLAWPNFAKFHYDNYLHIWEQFHYFLGAKYSRELGYTHLYECVAVADIEEGLGSAVQGGKIRDLRTNRIIPARSSPTIRDPRLCTGRFSSDRWVAFKADVGYFRGKMWARWGEVRQDHGYNASPVWALAGTAFANLSPASDTVLVLLSLLDVALLATLFGSVLWAFGWEALCVTLVFWGTNQTASYAWNGGGFLRMDWLAASVVAICFVRRGQPAAGGFLLTLAALLRLFPALLAVPLVFKAAAKMIRERRLFLSVEHRQFALGSLGALVVFVPLSLASPGASWTDFLSNTEKHMATYATNHVGLKTILSYRHADRGQVRQNTALDEPWSPWKAAQARRFAAMRWAFCLLVLGFLGLLAWRVAREEDWVALVLGIGVIPVVSYLACYYSAILLGYGLLYRRGREWVGAMLCAVSCLTWVLQLTWPWWDERYFWTSVLILGAVAATILGPRSEELREAER